MTEHNILIIRENPYYKRKIPLNKNKKVLKAFWISLRDFSKFLRRSEGAVEQDFRNMENMHKAMRDRSIKRWSFYAQKLAEMTGKEIDENIFF